MAQSKKTKERIDAITSAIAGGATFDSAAEASGINPGTLYRWMNEDSKFYEAIKKAELDRDTYGKELAISTIFGAMEKGIWQSAAWWLERVFPGKFRLQTGIDHTSKGEQVAGLTVEIVDTNTYINEN